MIIPRDKILDVWPLAVKYLPKALDVSDNKFTLEGIKKDCLAGDYLLWITQNTKAVAIIQVSEYHSRKECDIVILGGENIKSWISETALVEDFAKKIGCERMLIHGRKGWGKIHKDYNEAYRVIEKIL